MSGYLDGFRLVEAAALSNVKIPIIFQGDMGVSKSQIVKDVAAKLGMIYVDLRCATQEPGDLTGMPHIIDMKTFWANPAWIPNKDQKLMLAVEELNRASTDVQQAIMQALTEFKIHMAEFPDQTTIVICINPPNGIYHVGELDPAVVSRGWTVDIVPDIDEWIKYAYEAKLNDMVIQFVSTNREMFNKPTADGRCPIPRVWTNVSKLMDMTQKTGTEDLLSVVLPGTLGSSAAVAFMRFCEKNYKRPVTGREVLSNYKAVQERFQGQGNDAVAVTVNDVLHVVLSDGYRTVKTHILNLKAFIDDLPADHQFRLLKDLIPKTKIMEELSKTDVVEKITKVQAEIRKLKEENK